MALANTPRYFAAFMVRNTPQTVLEITEQVTSLNMAGNGSPIAASSFGSDSISTTILQAGVTPSVGMWWNEDMQVLRVWQDDRNPPKMIAFTQEIEGAQGRWAFYAGQVALQDLPIDAPSDNFITMNSTMPPAGPWIAGSGPNGIANPARGRAVPFTVSSTETEVEFGNNGDVVEGQEVWVLITKGGSGTKVNLKGAATAPSEIDSVEAKLAQFTSASLVGADKIALTTGSAEVSGWVFYGLPLTVE